MKRGVAKDRTLRLRFAAVRISLIICREPQAYSQNRSFARHTTA